MPRDKTANHVRLMAAARAEFLELGFEKASMRSIGERCGMTAAGIYRHCRDKEDLFDQLVSPAAGRLNTWLKEHVERYVNTVESSREPLWRDSWIDMMRKVVYPHMAGSAKFYQRTVTATKALNDTAVEYIGGIQVIKVFGKTKSSYERFVHDAYEAAHSFIDWMRASIIPFTFAMVIMPATMVSVLPIGGLLVKNGSLSAQDFVTVIILSVGVITPIITMMSYSDDFRTMGTIFGEVRAILDAPEMLRPTEGAVPAANDLELKDVRFAYRDKEVLHGVSMHIPEGSFVALVGPSGSGKSTIARLIASLWDVSDGSISLGGTDIRQIPQEAYADKIAFVSQDNYLFNMSVRENIRIGRPSATNAEVEEAARQSGCHDFILGLEKGYDTMVGSSGGHLSGGERQRISIARAMLKAAPIVILDEATAYTDPENENELMRAIQALTAEKTVVMIAHRLKTVEHADQILVIDHGRIVQQGNHESLMAEEGIYKTFIGERREAASWKVRT